MSHLVLITPVLIYSRSISHILEHEFFCLGRLGSSGQKGKKNGFEFFRETFEGAFQLFVDMEFFFFKFEKIVAFALISLQIFFLNS